MDPKDYWAIVERDHQIQNPTNAEKLSLLVEYRAIEDGNTILDFGSGLLRLIASRNDVRAIGLEINATFAADAKKTIAQSGLHGRIDIREGPALSYDDRLAAFDVTLCIGASFALGSFETALGWLKQRTKPGGRLAIGEPYASESRPQRPFARTCQLRTIPCRNCRHPPGSKPWVNGTDRRLA